MTGRSKKSIQNFEFLIILCSVDQALVFDLVILHRILKNTGNDGNIQLGCDKTNGILPLRNNMNKVDKNKNKRLLFCHLLHVVKQKLPFFFIPYCRPHYLRITKHGTGKT